MRRTLVLAVILVLSSAAALMPGAEAAPQPRVHRYHYMAYEAHVAGKDAVSEAVASVATPKGHVVPAGSFRFVPRQKHLTLTIDDVAYLDGMPTVPGGPRGGSVLVSWGHGSQCLRQGVPTVVTGFVPGREVKMRVTAFGGCAGAGTVGTLTIVD